MVCAAAKVFPAIQREELALLSAGHHVSMIMQCNLCSGSALNTLKTTFEDQAGYHAHYVRILQRTFDGLTFISIGVQISNSMANSMTATMAHVKQLRFIAAQIDTQASPALPFRAGFTVSAGEHLRS